jgi:hypothetical protein
MPLDLTVIFMLTGSISDRSFPILESSFQHFTVQEALNAVSSLETPCFMRADDRSSFGYLASRLLFAFDYDVDLFVCFSTVNFHIIPH